MADQNTQHISDALFRVMIDAMPDSIALIDERGTILYVNTAWRDFGHENGLHLPDSWPGVNYLQACNAAAAHGDADGKEVAAGILQVLCGEVPGFHYEYPCHSPEEKRWFMMQAVPLEWEGIRYCIISHRNITERKLAEEKNKALALLDGLTNISNRRYLEAFLRQEWQRASRAHIPLALIMLDIDHFKEFNDLYGHQAGDDCLRLIAHTLHNFAHRAGDMAARYGGEEFALVLSNTEMPEAARIAEDVRASIQALGICHEASRFEQRLTVSLGLGVVHPPEGTSIFNLVSLADKALYAAKAAGRNCVMTYTNSPASRAADTI